MDGSFLRRGKLLYKGLILLLVHRAVYIICRTLIVARSEKRIVHINAFKRDYWCYGIVKMQAGAIAELFELFGKRVAGKRSGRHDKLTLGEIGRFLRYRFDIWARLDFFGNVFGKSLTVNGKRTACGNAVFICAFHYQRAHFPHLRLEQSDGIG